MHQRYTLHLLLLLLLTAGVANAEKPYLMISGGIARPLAPEYFNDFWNGGWHVDAGVGYPISSHFVVAATFGYSRIPFDAQSVINHDRDIAPWIAVDGSTSTFLTANLQCRLRLLRPSKSSWISPYLSIALGWKHLTIPEIRERFRWTNEGGELSRRWLETDLSSTGWQTGVGVELFISDRINAFGEIGSNVGYKSERRMYSEWYPVRIGLILQPGW